MTTKGRGVVRLWVKTCSDYDEHSHPTELLYQTVFEGRVYELRATPEEAVFFVSPRHQVRAPSAALLEAVAAAGAPAGNASDGGGILTALEGALDAHLLNADKPSSVARFTALLERFDVRAPRAWRHESPAPGASGGSDLPPGA